MSNPKKEQKKQDLRGSASISEQNRADMKNNAQNSKSDSQKMQMKREESNM